MLVFTGILACGPSSDPKASAGSVHAISPGVTAGLPALGPSTDDRSVTIAAERYLQGMVDSFPERGTELGLHGKDAELDPYTTTAFDAAVDHRAALLDELRALPTSKLSSAAKTDLALLVGLLEVDVRRKRVERPLQRQPDLYTSPLASIFLMTARDYAPAKERAANVVARLEKIPAVVEAGRMQVSNPPKPWTEVAIASAASAKSFLESQRAFLEATLPDEKVRISKALRAAEQSYVNYEEFLRKEVLPRSNGTFHAGRELFVFLLQKNYFLETSPEELLAMGKAIFADTNARMTELAKRIDPGAKGWPDVTAKLKAHHPDAHGLLAAYRMEVSRARSFLVSKDAIELPPDDDLDVIDTPPFLRATTIAAYDQAPPFDTKTAKGFFFVTPIDMGLPKLKQEEMLRENDHGDVVNTAVHETYPGHHLQLSFARLNPSLTRKFAHASIFSEGWALYSEELLAELGYYTDEERMMQLEWTLVRAARVIVDIGLHVGDMSYEAAVKLLIDEVHLEKHLAVSEVKRYTASPTQPLSYLAGRQMIMELRERAKKRDGASFSLKKFHTDLLSRGTLPPGLLAHEMFGD